jgi:hypothetical protein
MEATQDRHCRLWVGDDDDRWGYCVSERSGEGRGAAHVVSSGPAPTRRRGERVMHVGTGW